MRRKEQNRKIKGIFKNNQTKRYLRKKCKKIIQNNLIDLEDLIGNRKNFIIRNFCSGIIKGIGAGIGFSIITAIIIYFVQKIVKLNIPIISQYISDILEIIKESK